MNVETRNSSLTVNSVARHSTGVRISQVLLMQQFRLVLALDILLIKFE